MSEQPRDHEPQDAVPAAATASQSGSPAAARAGAPSPPSGDIDQLQQAVALRADGTPILDLDAAPETFLGRLARLGMLTMLGVGGLFLIAYMGGVIYRIRYPFQSPMHLHDQAYLDRIRSESQFFDTPSDPRIVIPGAQSISRRYVPNSSYITLEEVQVMRTSVPFAAERIHQRWSAMAGVESIMTYSDQDIEVLARHARRGYQLRARVIRDPDRPGYALISARIIREPNEAERRGLSQPGWFPQPPPGAVHSSVGGGSGDAMLGRVHQYVVPGPPQAALNYYRGALNRDGWERMGSPHRPEQGTGVVEVYRRNDLGLTLQISPIIPSSTPRTLVALVPF